MCPAITTIIPAYNSEAYLERCVQSLLSQDFADYEIIIIDDGSTDKTLDIAQRMADTDTRIKVLHTENRGVSAARNLGLEHATGEYVNYVDSDDTVSSNYYSELYSAAQASKADIVQCRFDYVYENGDIKPDEVKSDCMIQGRSQILINHYNGMIGTITMALWDKLFKRDAIASVRLDTNLSAYEDVDYVYKVLSGCSTVKLIDSVLYHYHQRSGSAMHSGNNLQCFDVYERILNDIDDAKARKLLALRETKQALWFMREAKEEELMLLRKYAIKNTFAILGARGASPYLILKLVGLRIAPKLYFSSIRK